MINRNNIILLFCFLAILCSCTKAIIDEGEITPIDRVIKYNPDIQGIMYNHCITCHGGTAPSADFTLTSYEDVRSYIENGDLIDRINNANNPMPPSGLLSNENRQIIEKWVADGFPKN